MRNIICAFSKVNITLYILGVSKQDVLEWCLDNAIELVELEKPEDEEEEPQMLAHFHKVW